jgi:hypothetical protein
MTKAIWLGSPEIPIALQTGICSSNLFVTDQGLKTLEKIKDRPIKMLNALSRFVNIHVFETIEVPAIEGVEIMADAFHSSQFCKI